jgi:hypothetical protein
MQWRVSAHRSWCQCAAASSRPPCTPPRRGGGSLTRGTRGQQRRWSRRSALLPELSEAERDWSTCPPSSPGGASSGGQARGARGGQGQQQQQQGWRAGRCQPLEPSPPAAAPVGHRRRAPQVHQITQGPIAPHLVTVSTRQDRRCPACG